MPQLALLPESRVLALANTDVVRKDATAGGCAKSMQSRDICPHLSKASSFEVPRRRTPARDSRSAVLGAVNSIPGTPPLSISTFARHSSRKRVTSPCQLCSVEANASSPRSRDQRQRVWALRGQRWSRLHRPLHPPRAAQFQDFLLQMPTKREYPSAFLLDTGAEFQHQAHHARM